MTDYKVLDYEAAIERLDNDTELFRELVGIFFEEFKVDVETLDEAVQAQNARVIEERGHSLKSALGNVGAMSAYHFAYQLELAGRESSLDSVGELFSNLKTEVEKFRVEYEKKVGMDVEK